MNFLRSERIWHSSCRNIPCGAEALVVVADDTLGPVGMMLQRVMVMGRRRGTQNVSMREVEADGGKVRFKKEVGW